MSVFLKFLNIITKKSQFLNKGTQKARFDTVFLFEL